MREMLRRLIRRVGYDVVRYPPLHSHSGRMKRMFDFYQINLVFDVGANEGQFGRSLRQLGYSGKIISFEPLSKAHQKLQMVAETDPNWIVSPRMAIGRDSGEVTINVAQNLESSSILPMSSLHSNAAPESRYTATEKIAMNTLDAVALNYLSSASNAFIKIDTQGFEAEVLAGAAEVLSRVTGVQLEMSLVELYKGQSTYQDLIRTMINHGFMLADLTPGFSDPRTGHLLQADGIFIKQTM